MGKAMRTRHAIGAFAASLVVSLVISTAVAQMAGDKAKATSVKGTAAYAAASTSTIDHRVEVLTKALDLQPSQQENLRKIFADQRDAVRKIWSDPRLLPAERAPATRAVEDRTSDEIRAMLNDEQRKKYNPPKPAAKPGSPADAPNVAKWMEATRHN